MWLLAADRVYKGPDRLAENKVCRQSDALLQQETLGSTHAAPLFIH